MQFIQISLVMQVKEKINQFNLIFSQIWNFLY